MSLWVKILVALAPVIPVAMVYSLAQGNWGSAGTFAVLEVLAVVLYRLEMRNRSRKVLEYHDRA